MRKKNQLNRGCVGIGAALLTAVVSLSLVPAASGGGPVAVPEPPDNKIEVVLGEPISVSPLNVDESTTEEVRFDVDGSLIQTDFSPPYGENISTRGKFDRLGLTTEVTHTLTATAVEYTGTSHVIAEYPLVLHSVPLINRVEVEPLVIARRTKLVGFRLRNIARGYRVMAWGHGFRYTPGRYPLSLARRRGGNSSRTYRVPGGLEWRRGRHPGLIVSISPPKGESEFGVPVKGRVFTGVLKTDRRGDTRFRQTDGWKRCSWALSWNGRPPPRSSCHYYY